MWTGSLEWGKLPGGVSLSQGPHTLTCTATDSAGQQGSATVQVSSLSPYISVTEPLDGATVVSGQKLDFAGVAADIEDGALGIIWSSDIDGEVTNLQNFRPSDGVHTITATATDSDSNTVTYEATVTVAP